MCQLKDVAGLLFVVLLISQPVVGSELLLAAAREGDTAKLQSLLDNGVNVNSARADGLTALAEAVFYNNPQAIDLLIRVGADINVTDDYGVTLLHLACINQDAVLIQKLLIAGVKPNLAKRTGETPLMTCSNTGTVEGVRALLTHGANANAKENKEEQTALMWASAEGHQEIVRLLVADGAADVHARSKIIVEAKPHILEFSLDLSIWGSNYPSTIRWPETSGGFTALHFAAQKGNLEIAQILLGAGANINDTHSEYGNALLIAVASGHEEMALFLLQNGADLNVKDTWGATPLHYALHEGLLNLNGVKPVDDKSIGWSRQDMPTLVEALLDSGADPNARIEYEFPYLDDHFLARNDSVPAQISPVGATPILLAAASGNLQAIDLLEEVSDISATTIGGATLFMLAAGAGTEQKIRSEDEALKAAKHVLELGGTIDVNAYLTDIVPGGPGRGKADGRTALHFAALYGWPKMIRFLVGNGADLDAEDRYGVTPLMLALGDPEGRLAQNVGEFNNDHRYRRPGGERQSSGEGNNELAALLLELGATPCTCKLMDLTGR